METVRQKISPKTIFIFWIPLALTWLMMAAEGPYLSAVIARLTEAKYNLAAYGVAFSLAILIESPIIMIMSASTAMVKDALSLKKLFRYNLFLNALITLAMLILVIPPVFSFLAEDIIGLSEIVKNLTYISVIILIPWPAAIGFRRFYHGIMIRYNLTKRVAYGTMLRLTSMALTAVLLFKFSSWPGAYIGAMGLSVGVVCESIVTRIMANKILKRLKSIEENNSANLEKLTYRKINKFYYPLALTSILSLGAHPIVTFFMGQARMSLESLAVLPVVNSFIFIFRSFGLSFQEVIIAKMDDKYETYKIIRKFAIILTSVITLIIAIILYSPLIYVWFKIISGLSLELTQFAILPSRMLMFIPALTVWISFQRGVLVVGKITGPITMATVIELFGIIITLFLCIKYMDLIGVVAAAFAFMFGRLAADIYLIKPAYEVIKMQYKKHIHKS